MRRVRPEQDRLQGIVERMADGIVILGLNGTIRFANPAAQQIFGRSVEELTGADLGLPAVAGDSSEIEIVRGRGESITAELRVVETEWGEESVRLVSLRDITDRKRAEERSAQLARERLARAEAEASSHAKSEFLATMSHELRTPLNAVIGYAELLDLGIVGQMTEEQRQQVARIRDSARHLLGLVNEILDLAKVEAGQLSVHMRAAHARQAVDGALALAQPAAEAKGMALSGECSAEAIYDGDEDRVRQILVNLLSNAVKFTPPGGRVTVECEVTRRPDPEARVTGSGPWVCLRVCDTGVGIPSDKVAAIFDPFVQVEGGHTRSKDGSGLGLTISRRLARLMGGDLTVRSERGQGSVFTLWMREASAAQRETALWRAESSATAARLQGLADVGLVLMRELPTIVDAFVDRLRAETIAPGAPALRASQLADHVASYLADIACTLSAIEESRGQPSPLVADGAEIQTKVSERHGAQRARLGWSANALYREWSILREEIDRAIRRRVTALPERAIDEALIVIDRFIEQAAQASVRALERTAPVGALPRAE
jgi:signal transduction histidine kinase